MMKNSLIGEILLEQKKIDAEQLWAALEEQAKTGARLGAVLVRHGCLAEEDVLTALSAQTGLEALPAGVKAEAISPEMMPETRFLKHYSIAPLRITEGRMEVAVADPLDPFPVEALRVFTGLDAKAYLWTEKKIQEAIEERGRGALTVGKIAGEIDKTQADDIEDDAAQLADLADKAPVINLVNLIIKRAQEKRASDIHIEPFDGKLHVRYRVDGVLSLSEELPKGLHQAVASRIKIMSKLNIAERRLPQDGRIKVRAGQSNMDIRVSTVPTLHGESIVMRLLDPSGIRSLEEVGFSPGDRDTFAAMIRQPHGMLLVTGPTGSGKSTTLYAGLNEIDRIEKKVITIEDPVEYDLEGVNQIQVKPKIGFNFANGLRSIVRQDPDVIMVGEIRDSETAEIAIHSALTGHLILSTLHTNDAPGAVTRLMDMGVESYLISSSVLGVLAQRLVRVICRGCMGPDTAEGPGIMAMAAELKGDLPITAYRGKGCGLCDGTGYRGRTAIFEFMKVSDSLRNMIAGKQGADIMKKKAVEEGMITLRQDGWRKVLEGITTIDEVSRVTLDC